MGQIGVPSGDPDLELVALRRRMLEMDRRSAVAAAANQSSAPRGIVAWHNRISGLYPMTVSGTGLWRICALAANLIKGRAYTYRATLGIYGSGQTYPAYTSLDLLTYWTSNGTQAKTDSPQLGQSNLFLDCGSYVHSHEHEVDIPIASLPGNDGDVIPVSIMFVARPIHSGINYGAYATPVWPMRFRIEDNGLNPGPFSGVEFSG